MTDDDTQNHLDAWARGETSYRRTWTTTPVLCGNASGGT